MKSQICINATCPTMATKLLTHANGYGFASYPTPYCDEHAERIVAKSPYSYIVESITKTP